MKATKPKKTAQRPSLPRRVSQHVCPGNGFRGCGHPAQLVAQQVSKPNQDLGIKKPFVIRAYLCRWHLGWLNRYRKAKGKSSVQWKQELPDAEVLANGAGEQPPPKKETL